MFPVRGREGEELKSTPGALESWRARVESHRGRGLMPCGQVEEKAEGLGALVRMGVRGRKSG